MMKMSGWRRGRRRHPNHRGEPRRDGEARPSRDRRHDRRPVGPADGGADRLTYPCRGACAVSAFPAEPGRDPLARRAARKRGRGSRTARRRRVPHGTRCSSGAAGWRSTRTPSSPTSSTPGGSVGCVSTAWCAPFVSRKPIRELRDLIRLPQGPDRGAGPGDAAARQGPPRCRAQVVLGRHRHPGPLGAGDGDSVVPIPVSQRRSVPVAMSQALAWVPLTLGDAGQLADLGLHHRLGQ